MPLHRCPNQLISNRELEAVQAAALVEHGHLPDAGGWQDQAATFVEAYPLLMREINHWRGVARDMAMRNAKKGR